MMVAASRRPRTPHGNPSHELPEFIIIQLMVDTQAALDAARSYLRTHPEELSRAVRGAMGLRFGVPLVALRWIAKQAEKEDKLEDIRIDAVPPGLKLGAHVDAMGAPLRVSATIYIDRIVFSDEELTLALRVENIDLKVTGPSKSPLGALIQSGALDLSNPGTLLAYMPERPPIIAEANGNRLVLDLMRDPKIGKNPLARRAVAVLTSFVTLHRVGTESKHLDVAFRALPTGMRGAFQSVRRNVVLPAMGRLLPRGR